MTIRRLTKEDANRLCRICKSNGFFASQVVYADSETFEGVVKYIDDTVNETYSSTIKEILKNVDAFNGWKSKGRIYIPKTELNRYLEENDIDPLIFFKWADRTGLIAKRGKNNRTSSARNGDKIVRCAIFNDFDSKKEC